MTGIVWELVENYKILFATKEDEILSRVFHLHALAEDAAFFFLSENEGSPPGCPYHLISHSIIYKVISQQTQPERCVFFPLQV
jgi:hypothetical protein